MKKEVIQLIVFLYALGSILIGYYTINDGRAREDLSDQIAGGVMIVAGNVAGFHLASSLKLL